MEEYKAQAIFCLDHQMNSVAMAQCTYCYLIICIDETHKKEAATANQTFPIDNIFDFEEFKKPQQ